MGLPAAIGRIDGAFADRIDTFAKQAGWTRSDSFRYYPARM